MDIVQIEVYPLARHPPKIEYFFVPYNKRTSIEEVISNPHNHLSKKRESKGFP
jgi:hypothetical protein